MVLRGVMKQLCCNVLCCNPWFHSLGAARSERGQLRETAEQPPGPPDPLRRPRLIGRTLSARRHDRGGGDRKRRQEEDALFQINNNIPYIINKSKIICQMFTRVI